MSDESKDELQREAREAGVSVERGETKADIEEKLDTANPEALGPPVPPGETDWPAPKQKGTPIKGVAPKTDADLDRLGVL